MRLCTIVVLSLSLHIEPSWTYNILGVFPDIYRSLYICGGSLMRSLAADGHNVSVVSPFPNPSPLPNFRDIRVLGAETKFKDLVEELMGSVEINPIHILYVYTYLAYSITEYNLSHPAMVELLTNKEEHFDVIVVDVILADALLGLGQHYNAPIVAFSTLSTLSVASLVGNPAPMSFMPNILLTLTDRMSFGQRLDNAIMSMFEGIVTRLYYTYQEDLYNRVFTRVDKPSFREVLQSVDLVLLNQHYSTHVPRPNMPNMIEVGGLHINTDHPDELPLDLRTFIEDAEHGVIYLSLGSHVRSTNLPMIVRDDLLMALGQLKERILWKWEHTDLPAKPANVMIQKWFPQNEVLAHPKIKLFITNGGLLSITETIFHGVPIVGIPFFGDQALNINAAVSQGAGLNIKHTNITVDSMLWAISEVLTNSSYTDQARKMSRRYRDQPVKPMDLAKFWVNYVARHGGAKHMNSASQELLFYQYYSLDVIAVLSVTGILWIYLIWMASISIFGRK